ncbi:unnamed protein product [Caenorhabditis bovis]|uniref:MATH domain-containing protein n=1 Tax=Caenorhabditis bovis TaxID=2654633 RepID=A0A8S1ESY8_9PELO|nr:unnamed protein product [Caenorhabditis bovis]
MGETDKIINWKIRNVSQLIPRESSSPIKIIGDHLWRLTACTGNVEKSDDEKCLATHAHCFSFSKDDAWFCDAEIEYRILFQCLSKRTAVPKSHTFTHRYDAHHSNFGFPNIIRWSELMNPDNGYVLNDSIIIQAKIRYLDDYFVIPMIGTELVEQTIQWRLPNISQLSTTYRELPMQYICNNDNIPWFVKANSECSDRTDHENYLTTFVIVNEDSASDSWSCQVYFEIRLLFQKLISDDDAPIMHSREAKLSASCTHTGIVKFIEMSELLDPKNGYILNDSVILKIHLILLKTNGF